MQEETKKTEIPSIDPAIVEWREFVTIKKNRLERMSTITSTKKHWENHYPDGTPPTHFRIIDEEDGVSQRIEVYRLKEIPR